MMTTPVVRAKFRCTEKQERWIGGKPDEWDQVAVEVKLNPVWKDGEPLEKDGIHYSMNAIEENMIFGKATPAGSIAMLIKNKTAADAFELGQSYYVDFSPTEG